MYLQADKTDSEQSSCAYMHVECRANSCISLAIGLPVSMHGQPQVLAPACSAMSLVETCVDHTVQNMITTSYA